jgi:hypothetical protein
MKEAVAWGQKSMGGYRLSVLAVGKGLWKWDQARCEVSKNWSAFFCKEQTLGDIGVSKMACQACLSAIGD